VVPAPFEVTFDTTSMSGSLACINISIPQDLALEGDHEFTVHLLTPLSPDVVTIGSPVYTTVVIADDESKCIHTCMVCAYNVSGKWVPSHRILLLVMVSIEYVSSMHSRMLCGC